MRMAKYRLMFDLMVTEATQWKMGGLVLAGYIDVLAIGSMDGGVVRRL